MTPITFNLPDEVFSARKQPPREFIKDLRLAAAIHWYARGEISMEKGAMIAGLDRVDFLAALAAEQVEVFNIDWVSLEQELNHV